MLVDGFGSAPAIAHQMNLSNARIELRSDRSVDVAVALNGSDIDRLIGTKIYDERANQVRTDALGPASARIADYILQHAVVSGAGEEPCAHTPAEVQPDGDGVAVRVLWKCGDADGRLLYRSTVLTSLDPSARQVVLIHGPDGESQALLDASDNEVMLARGPPPSTVSVMGRYLAAGIKHLVLGYDHIAFLIAVLLCARRVWPVVKIVTSFTIAHSITLWLAALRIVEIPAEIVEPAIAASIVFVALENFYSRDIDRRWRITFLFGLIHGFAFAVALQEFGLPRGALVQALGSFNIGVEIGQIGIVSIVIPLLLQLDRIASGMGGGRRSPAVVYAVSALITVLGCYWFLDRTVLT